MRNNSTEEERDTVGSVICKQLYQTQECKFLQNFVNTRGVMRRTHALVFKFIKAAVKATDGGDWEMLAPTNDGHVIQSANSRHSKQR
jgi:hypothetical protein